MLVKKGSRKYSLLQWEVADLTLTRSIWQLQGLRTVKSTKKKRPHPRKYQISFHRNWKAFQRRAPKKLLYQIRKTALHTTYYLEISVRAVSTFHQRRKWNISLCVARRSVLLVTPRRKWLPLDHQWNIERDALLLGELPRNLWSIRFICNGGEGREERRGYLALNV